MLVATYSSGSLVRNNCVSIFNFGNVPFCAHVLQLQLQRVAKVPNALFEPKKNL